MSVLQIVLIDNYDSFTYNLYQELCVLGGKVQVFRNDAVEVGAIEAMRPDLIVISPGPKRPEDAGISKEVIRRLGPAVPIFGVCLGHQCINEVYGGRTVRAPEPWHGKTSNVLHDGRGPYRGLPQPLAVARYHSLVIDRETVSPDLAVTSWTEDGIVMGVRHKTHPVEGVQFHPESFLTAHGHAMLENICTDVQRRRHS